MRCRETGGFLLERELGCLDRAVESALVAHLDSCPACARLARAERALTQELVALRLAPLPIPDVSARVLAGLPEAVRPSVDHPSVAQLGWAAAAAILVSIGLATAAVSDASALFDTVRRAFAALDAVASPLAEAAGAIGGKLWTTASALKGLLAPLAALLARLEPLALTSLATGALLMAATILLVIGRDLRLARFAGGGGS